MFDRIEPDVGMPHHIAQSLFHQLINGVEYLHSIGITHRDLKPENLLIDANDVLKIVDFGFATLFRHKKSKRLMTKACGTPPYVAPEVILNTPYEAEPADIWSCAIVLVAMLAGELPWDEPSFSCDEYNMWLNQKITHSPWNKIDTIPLGLLKSILNHDPKCRLTIDQIKRNRWYQQRILQKRKSTWGAGERGRKRFISDDDIYEMSASQPSNESVQSLLNSSGTISNDSVGTLLNAFLSQPNRPQDMLLSSQLLGTPGESQTIWQRLVKRMTRFWSKKDAKSTLKRVKNECVCMGYCVKTLTLSELIITTTDRRSKKLVFKALIYQGATDAAPTDNHHTLVEVRLSKGDGLEFKRHYEDLKKNLTDLILPAL